MLKLTTAFFNLVNVVDTVDVHFTALFITPEKNFHLSFLNCDLMIAVYI